MEPPSLKPAGPAQSKSDPRIAVLAALGRKESHRPAVFVDAACARPEFATGWENESNFRNAGECDCRWPSYQLVGCPWAATSRACIWPACFRPTYATRHPLEPVAKCSRAQRASTTIRPSNNPLNRARITNPVR